MIDSKLDPVFMHNEYLFRRKVFKFPGAAFHIYDRNGSILFYSEQKPLRLKEDFRVYSDKSKSRELLVIKTPQIIDFSPTYYVKDATTGESVGALKRKGWKSLVRDEWIFLSNDGRRIGKLTESSMKRAILSRFRILAIGLIPQEFIVLSREGREICRIKQHFNPFVLKYTLKIHDQDPPIDRRLLIAGCILLLGIEGRQR
ncbi:MAG TPA: hypothetical protein EYP86_04410 [Candidatus Altiarchaeales archaeon]|nr:hypothetical protein [Candidatus Altiarchaeales archaeon]